MEMDYLNYVHAHVHLYLYAKKTGNVHKNDDFNCINQYKHKL